MSRAIFGWFSANEDGKVVAKTDVHGDGRVHRYPYTKEDDISKGHGHEIFNDMQDFIDDKKSEDSRDKDDIRSKDRHWRGNGYNFTKDGLITLKEELLSYEHLTSLKILIKK